jgi:GT2 family glycosyltransferase
MAPLFYIIVTTYNHTELLGRSINSVLQQDNPNCRICIVDDGPSLATLDALKPLRVLTIELWCTIYQKTRVSTLLEITLCIALKNLDLEVLLLF